MRMFAEEVRRNAPMTFPAEQEDQIAGGFRHATVVSAAQITVSIQSHRLTV